MERALCSIQKVVGIEPIEGAEKIEICKVLGWQVVTLKNEFKPGDLCVFCEVDAFLPCRPEFEFLRKNCFRKMWDGSEGFRIKTVRLKKQLSQGICFPLSILGPHCPAVEGQDVTELLGVKKWEVPIPAELSGRIEGQRPEWIPRTDELRIQSYPDLLQEMKGVVCYCTTKIDGTSGSFGRKDDEYVVSSRKLVWKEDEGNAWWMVYRRYNIEQVLKEAGNYVIQGEVAGPGINKNKLMLKEPELFVFNMIDVNTGKYFDFMHVWEFCRKYNLQTVPRCWSGIAFDFTMEQLLEMAHGKYPGTDNDIEGIVIRPIYETYSNVLKGRMSIKVLNNTALEKED